MGFFTLTAIKCHTIQNNIVLLMIIAIFLVACGTTSPSKKTTITSQKQPTNVVDSTIKADQILQNTLTQTGSEAIASLLTAAKSYLNENQTEKAIAIALKSQALTLTHFEKYQFALVLAEGFYQTKHLMKGLDTLNIANKLKQQGEFQHTIDYFRTLALIQTARNLPVQSINAQLHVLSLTDDNSAELINNIWQQLIQLADWQKQQLLELNPPQIKGWDSLLSFCNKFADNDTLLQSYIKQWQQKHINHPAQIIADQLLQLPQLTIASIEQIAVILPLSGKQQQAGAALQQGILAAYGNNNAATLHFIDSANLDMTTLHESLTELNIDYVIGPLLKSNVKKYVESETLNTPTLLLNLPSGITLQPQHVVLSMRPEDEALQAASTLSQLQFKHPLVLSQKDSTSKRISQAFIKHWQIINGDSPEIVYFNRGTKMQQQLKSSLEVDLSQKRIKAIDSKIKYSIKSEQRNRRDIDMIYIVGQSLPTKLLKPYIDVNTSPFADQIPVYASSRSHNSKANKDDRRDLSGLIFSDMPWKISSKQQNKVVLNETLRLWPNRSDSLESIFAMGYDSLALINKIPLMQQRTYLRHFGQTGILKLNNDNILSRSLLWGKYYRNRVKEIDLEK